MRDQKSDVGMQGAGQRIDKQREVTASLCVYESQEEGVHGM
jgi:hypothetical protein